MVVHAGEAVGRRIERRRRLAVRAERLAVEIELGVVLARPPALQHLAHGGVVDLQELRKGAEIRRKRHDRADVEIAVRPAVEPATDALAQRIVDSGVAERAGDADRPQPFSLEKPFDANNGIGL